MALAPAANEDDDSNQIKDRPLAIQADPDIVDLIDPGMRKSVWRAVTQSRLKKEPSTVQEDYNQAATAIFLSFPPGQYTAQ